MKYRKQQRGRMSGLSTRGAEISFGEYGLKALEPAWITGKQIEASRVAMTRFIKRGGKIWIRVFPDKPITKKPAETRMGKGKGAPEGWVAVVKPGRVLFEMEGVDEKTAREAIRLAGGVLGGRKLKAICPSGPSFGFLTAEQADTPIDFPARDKDGNPSNPIAKAGTTVGSAAIMIIAEGTDMVDLALNLTKFYRNESCGKCVPCRVGSQKMVDIIAGIIAGTARDTDLDDIEQLGETLTLTSICGLGQVAIAPFLSVMKAFPEEVAARFPED